LLARKGKGELANVDVEINSNLSAAENFVRLRKIDKCNHRLVPLSPVRQPFVLFSEIELVHLFWKSPIVRRKLQDMTQSTKTNPTQEDVLRMLRSQAPGAIITALITVVGKKSCPHGYRRSSKVMPLEE
ncbi:hypothetical protein BGX34_008906, partial [Mortierella sp. NVP85]